VITDLSLDARLLYASDSITDVLGYEPAEVVGKSCYEYFHPDEIPFARSTHERGVKLDKAAVLAYCKIRSKEGQWIGCECAFTVVHDVLVACTSIYRRSPASQSEYISLCSFLHTIYCISKTVIKIPTPRSSRTSASYPPLVCVLTKGPSIPHALSSFCEVSERP
jgi:PAS domain S-box-containing protein